MVLQAPQDVSKGAARDARVISSAWASLPERACLNLRVDAMKPPRLEPVREFEQRLASPTFPRPARLSSGATHEFALMRPSHGHSSRSSGLRRAFKAWRSGERGRLSSSQSSVRTSASHRAFRAVATCPK